MAFLNTFLVVFEKKQQRRIKNKEIKTLNTFLHKKREETLWRTVNLENVLNFLYVYFTKFRFMKSIK